MTDAVFQRDSYLQQLDAVVTALDAEFVELDKTIFYAEGGGQPGDTGWLTGGGWPNVDQSAGHLAKRPAGWPCGWATGVSVVDVATSFEVTAALDVIIAVDVAFLVTVDVIMTVSVAVAGHVRGDRGPCPCSGR